MRVNKKPSVEGEKVVEKYTLHNVHIIDASGSMRGGKYDNAIKGVQEELKKFEHNDDVNLTQTIVEFDSTTGYSSDHVFGYNTRVTKHYFMTAASAVTSFKPVGASGGTPLYEVLGNVIEEVLQKKGPNDRVILTVMTDGQNTDHRGKYSDTTLLAELIESVQKNHFFTVTFMGTERDTNEIIRILKLSKENTLVHDNTSRGMERSYRARTTSLMSYSKSVASGQAVTDSFFAQEKEKK